MYAQFAFYETHRPFEGDPYTEKGVMVPGYLEPTEEMRADLARFQAEVNTLDEYVGAVLESLEKAGIREETIVVFASDHGIPYPGAKWWCRDPGVEISLIVDAPSAEFDRDGPIDALISNVDVVPTLLDYIGVDVPEAVEGVSFHGYLAGERSEPPRETAFTQYTSPGNEARGVVTEEYTLVRNFGGGLEVDYPVDADPTTRVPSSLSPVDPPRPFAQLYDRREDSANLDSLAPDRPAVVEELTDRLQSWMAAVDDPLLDGGVRYPYFDRAMDDFHGASTGPPGGR